MRVLLGLVAGFALGWLVAAMPAGGAGSFVLAVLTPVGTIFVNLIRMTVIPLVMSLLIATLGGASASRGLGRTGARALLISLTLLTLAAVASGLIADRVLSRLAIDAAASRTLTGGALPQRAPALRRSRPDCRPRAVQRRQGRSRRRDAAAHRLFGVLRSRPVRD
ncbi:MAG: cation:dicarboxylase symporter family transporter [Vicinamibacterales bacterium]